MDEWYQCRWATGSEFAIWPDTLTFFREYYGKDRPQGEIIPLTERILDLFHRNNIQATFFFTGEIARYYPQMVKKIAAEGHEIGSHNLIHKDYHDHNKKDFFNDLKKSKTLLEDMTGKAVTGYRAPNSIVSNYMIEDLIRLGFKYDSSITPTKLSIGKFGRFAQAPLNPYEVSVNDFSKPGKSGLWEFPWPVFPLLNLPSGSGIMTRVAGYRYIIYSLEHALKTGDTTYYFHPYETGQYPKIKKLNIRNRIFLRNLGTPYFHMIEKLIERYRKRFISGEQLLLKHVNSLI